MALRLLLWLPVSAVVGSTILIVMARSQSGSTAARPAALSDCRGSKEDKEPLQEDTQFMDGIADERTFGQRCGVDVNADARFFHFSALSWPSLQWSHHEVFRTSDCPLQMAISIGHWSLARRIRQIQALIRHCHCKDPKSQASRSMSSKWP